MLELGRQGRQPRRFCFASDRQIENARASAPFNPLDLKSLIAFRARDATRK
jgi:hypothetical protein